MNFLCAYRDSDILGNWKDHRKQAVEWTFVLIVFSPNVIQPINHNNEFLTALFVTKRTSFDPGA
jgi:mRNA-degrading endonuclease YafQ of YafQ-DinJ toxin-antitoxin module